MFLETMDWNRFLLRPCVIQNWLAQLKCGSISITSAATSWCSAQASETLAW